DGGGAEILSNAVIRNGRLWTSHAFQVDSTGAASDTGGRDGIRWYELQNLSTIAPSVKQTGTIFDSNAVAPNSYWMPSVMVSGQGHTAFGFSQSGTGSFASAVNAGRLATDAVGAVSLPNVYQTSTSAYAPAADPSTPKRWGDYS